MSQKKTDVLDTQREKNHVKMETDFVLPCHKARNAKHCQKTPEASQRQGGILPQKRQEGDGPANALISGFQSPEPEKVMAPHSSTLAWKIPWTEEPGGLQSMGSLSWTRLSDFTFTFRFHALEKEMATHSSRIPRTGEPGGLPSTGSHRVGHD